MGINRKLQLLGYVISHSPQPEKQMQNTDITTTAHGGSINPFQRSAMSEHVNAGTVEIESSRAIAEAQGKLVMAKRFPRDEARAYSKIIESCRRRGLAEEATYSFPRGGQTVSGPSIRLAEELARAWGNIDYGIRELSRREGVSEMEAYAWDLETNTSSSQKFSVRHIRDTRGGGQVLTDERDIYELTANQGARRLRARVLAILPPDIVEAALAECRSTLAGGNGEPIADRVRKMIRAFEKYGVTSAMIELRLGHSLDLILPDEIADLQGVHNSLKGGMSKAADWFGGGRTEREASDVLDETPDVTTQQPVAAAAPAPARKTKAAPKPAAAEPTPQAAEPAPEETKNDEQIAADDGDIFG